MAGKPLFCVLSLGEPLGSRRAAKRRALRLIVGVVGLVCLTVCSACDKEAAERRARQAAEKMKESLPDVAGTALAQNLPPEEVRQLQQQLTAVKEYQGEITGELDSVTLNALQAFQRAQGINDNGVVTDQTKKLLQTAAAKAAP